MRTAAQHLHRPRRRSAVDLVRHLTGVQAQVLSAAGLALRARTESLTAQQVDRARLHDRSIVLTWAMRGTLHLIGTEDFGWLQPLVVEPRVSNAVRRLKEEGVSADQPSRAVRLIARMLGREGSLTRSEIGERLRRRGIRTEGQAIAHLNLVRGRSGRDLLRALPGWRTLLRSGSRLAWRGEADGARGGVGGARRQVSHRARTRAAR